VNKKQLQDMKTYINKPNIQNRNTQQSRGL